MSEKMKLEWNTNFPVGEVTINGVRYVPAVPAPAPEPRGALTEDDPPGWYQCLRMDGNGNVPRALWWNGGYLCVGPVGMWIGDKCTDFIRLVPANQGDGIAEEAARHRAWVEEKRLALCKALKFSAVCEWRDILDEVETLVQRDGKREVRVGPLALPHGCWALDNGKTVEVIHSRVFLNEGERAIAIAIPEFPPAPPKAKAPRVFKVLNRSGREYDAVEWVGGRITIRDRGGWDYMSLESMKEAGWSEVEREGKGK